MAYLADRMSLDEVARLLDRFGGYRVPKRSALVEQARNTRILVACLLRTLSSKTVLTEQAARAVADEFGMDVQAVQRRWYAWNRTGRPRLAQGASTDEATADETFRY